MIILTMNMQQAIIISLIVGEPLQHF